MMAAEQQTVRQLCELLDRVVLDGEMLDAQFAAIGVSGLALDSRRVAPGDLFLACSGLRADGRDFIESAVQAGAVAVVAERGQHWQRSNLFQGVPVIVVSDLTRKLSYIGSRFYGEPSRQIPIVGVTGTNGKTSCTQLFMQLANLLGQHCGVIGTLGVGIDGTFEEGVNTTPDPITIQRTLADWAGKRLDVGAMEVSSHGLEQGRVEAVCFDQAVFTNLTRDHLDYHGTMQAYGDAKARLFRMPGLRTAIINGDDPFAKVLCEQLPQWVDRYVYRTGKASATAPAADVWVDNVRFHDSGVSARLCGPWGRFDFTSALLGAFNLSNLVAVVTAMINSGVPAETVVAAVAGLHTVAGRMERIPSSTGLMAVVDYAHTPDALEKALLAMRQHSAGKVWCVFGCGGDRDQGKRAQMGDVAQRHADHVVVTSDNPRNEDPASIINEILGGVDRPTLVEEDRARAIEFAVSNAATGDAILVAGKGHESYQQIGDTRIPYSDIKQVRLALARREQGQGGAQ